MQKDNESAGTDFGSGKDCTVTSRLRADTEYNKCVEFKAKFQFQKIVRLRKRRFGRTTGVDINE
jgi:hypothetical protein